MSAIEPFRALAFNNAVANHRLLGACRGLTAAAFAAPRTGFFPSLKGTLNHNLLVDRFYISAMEGEPLGEGAFEDREPYADPERLAAAQGAMDRRLIAVAKLMEPQRIVLVPRRTEVQRERLDRLLLHLFQHQIHHRGQAHAMLSGAGLKPPQLDEFFCRDEAPLRAADLAALGFAEADVWDDPLA